MTTDQHAGDARNNSVPLSTSPERDEGLAGGMAMAALHKHATIEDVVTALPQIVAMASERPDFGWCAEFAFLIAPLTEMHLDQFKHEQDQGFDEYTVQTFSKIFGRALWIVLQNVLFARAQMAKEHLPFDQKRTRNLCADLLELSIDEETGTWNRDQIAKLRAEARALLTGEVARG